jgi:hypothetical protein
MIAEIENYLKSNLDFKEGVALYLKFSVDKAYSSLFGSSETGYARRKLIEQLGLLSKSSVVEHPKPKKIPDIEAYRAKRESKVVDIDYNSLPDVLKEKVKHKRALYTQARDMHSSISMEKWTDSDRYEIAQKIIENFDFISDIWKELEDYQEKGILRTPSQKGLGLDQLSALELANIRDNYKKNLYKIRKDPTKESRLKQLNEMIVEVEAILKKK